MLQVFKRNDISAYVALLIVTVLCKLKFLMHPLIIHPQKEDFQGLFFNLGKLHLFFTNHPTLYVFLSIMLQFGFAVFINYVVLKQKLYPHKNNFTALSFILITSFFPQFNFLSAAFISMLFSFAAFSYVLKLSSTPLPRKWCFNIGCMLSLAVMFYFPSIIFLLLFMIFISYFRPFSLQEYAACLLGFLTPVYFALAILYLQQHLTVALSHLNFHLQLPVALAQPVPALIFVVTLIILLTGSLYIAGKNALKNPIVIRKKWSAVYAYLFFAVLTSLVSKVFPSASFIMALTPISILLSQSFQNRKEKWNIFTFFFLIISILSLQWILLK